MSIMLDEIMEEPEAIENTYRINSEKLHELQEILEKSEFIFVTGSGTSYHAAHYLSMLLLASGMRSAPFHSPDYGDFMVSKIARGSVNIVFSQSGESLDALQNMKLSKGRGIKVIGVTNEENSTLARESDFPIITGAGRERSVAATKSHTVQLAISMAIYNQINSIDNTNEITMVAGAIRKIVSRTREIEQFAARLTERIVFLGSELAYPSAMEGDLKFKETSGIISEAYSTREYLHGPIHRINKSTSIVLLGGNHEVDQSVFNRLKEGTDHILRIGGKDSHIAVPEANHVILPIFYVTVLQILANAMALKLGYDPDHPENLTKVVRE